MRPQDLRFRPHSRSPKGWFRTNAEEEGEIGSGSYILQDRGKASSHIQATRYLIWPLSEPRVAVFWPGIVLRGFTFISILITRSLGSRFGTRYPSTPCTVYPCHGFPFFPSFSISVSPLLSSSPRTSSNPFSFALSLLSSTCDPRATRRAF